MRVILGAVAWALASGAARAALPAPYCSWSADGSRLLCAGGRSLQLLDSKGQAVASFTAPADLTGAVLSPDGRRAAYTLAPGELWVWDSASGTASRVCAPESGMQACVSPQWSPDGTRLVYGVVEQRKMTTPFDDPVKSYSVMLAALDGTAPRAVVVYQH